MKNNHAFWTGEVAKALGVSTDTIRVWALKLESLGIIFTRDQHDRRAFTHDDVVMFRYLQSLLEGRKTGLDHAIEITYEKFNAMHDQMHDQSITLGSSETELNALEVNNSGVFQMVKALSERLEEQDRKQDRILEVLEIQNERIKRQEEAQERRDQQLMQTLREIQEMRRLEAERKKSIFGRIFGK